MSGIAVESGVEVGGTVCIGDSWDVPGVPDEPIAMGVGVEPSRSRGVRVSKVRVRAGIEVESVIRWDGWRSDGVGVKRSVVGRSKTPVEKSFSVDPVWDAAGISRGS